MRAIMTILSLALVSSSVFASAKPTVYSLDNLAYGITNEFASKALYNYVVSFKTRYGDEDASDPVMFRSPVIAKITCFFKEADGATCHIVSLDKNYGPELYEQEPISLLSGAAINESAMKALWNYVTAVGSSSTAIHGALDAKLICSSGGINLHACFVKSID